nr:acetate--CoA ligase family protein [uncultured Oscillibacter sp.]
MSLYKLFKPRRVAIVGASESESLGGRAAAYFHQSRHCKPEDIFYVNPKKDTIFGQTCYHDLEEVPAPLDMVVIATSKKTVEGLLRTAHEKGAEAAVIYASGFGETGDPEDAAAEARLKQFCRENGMSVLGPNCAGYINFVDGIYPYGFYFDMDRKPGNVGVVSQSGQICSSMLLSHKANFSYLISCGNSKITTIEDYLEFLVNDPHTSVVAAYIEGVTRPEKFVSVLKRAAELGKPVVFIKSGRSAGAVRAAASHTGSMAGSDKSYDAVFRKFGVIRVDDIEELACVTSTLSLLPHLPEKNAVAVMCGSGGESAISADQCELYGLHCPAFSAETCAALKTVLPDYASTNNPLDLTAAPTVDMEINKKTLRAVAGDPGIALTVVGIPLFDVERKDTEVFVSAMESLMLERPDSAIVCVPNVETGRLPDMVERLREAHIPVLTPGKYAYESLKKVMDYAAWRATADLRTLDLAVPQPLEGTRRALSEYDSKKLLSGFGVPVPPAAVAVTEDEAVRYAEEIGYPVVLKIDSAEILHKSDVGAVMLNVRSPQEVREKYRQILANVRAKRPEAGYNGILVQKMIPTGLEVIVGVNVDPQFGPMVLLGLGGVFVELFRDVALYPAPFGRPEAMMMIDSLKSSAMFHGYRGGPELDVDALADTLVAVSQFAVANRDHLLEMDINPLFVYEKGKGVSAADGLVVLK